MQKTYMNIQNSGKNELKYHFTQQMSPQLLTWLSDERSESTYWRFSKYWHQSTTLISTYFQFLNIDPEEYPSCLFEYRPSAPEDTRTLTLTLWTCVDCLHRTPFSIHWLQKIDSFADLNLLLIFHPLSRKSSFLNLSSRQLNKVSHYILS